jgi:hypothetical protein
MRDLHAIGGLKVAVDTQVQEKALDLIQAWAEAFHDVRDDMPMFDEIYHRLKAEGIRFPARNVDAMPPMFANGGHGDSNPRAQLPDTNEFGQPVAYRPTPTTQQRAPTQGRPQQRSAPSGHDGSHGRRGSGGGGGGGGGHLNVEKLQADLALVRNNAELLGVMVSSTDTSAEDISKNEVIMDLHQTCKAMHDKMMSLVQQVQDEVTIATLLEVNDELMNVLAKQTLRQPLRPHSKQTLLATCLDLIRPWHQVDKHQLLLRLPRLPPRLQHRQHPCRSKKNLDWSTLVEVLLLLPPRLFLPPPLRLLLLRPPMTAWTISLRNSTLIQNHLHLLLHLHLHLHPLRQFKSQHLPLLPVVVVS